MSILLGILVGILMLTHNILQIIDQGQIKEYSRFSCKMRLKEKRERIYYDERGRIATNTKQQNAKYTSDMIRNATRDSNQYYRYKRIIGDSVGSLADFQQMKYNNLRSLKF